MNAMNYRGYSARVEYDAQDNIFVGHVIGIRDIVSFHGVTVDELETHFRQAVDDYLEACKRLGQEPNQPYSGKMMLRVPPELHAAVAAAAQGSGKSINQWASVVLSRETRQ